MIVPAIGLYPAEIGGNVSPVVTWPNEVAASA